MPRGSRFPVAGLEAVAKVTVRTMRRLPGATRLGLKDGLRKDALSGDRKAVEKTPEEIAISLWFWKLKSEEGSCYPFCFVCVEAVTKDTV